MQSKWSRVKLNDILTERREKPDLYAILSGEIPIVAKIGFDTGKIELREESKTKTDMILIKPGDLVVSGINAAKGAIAIYGEENKTPAAATIHYSSYIANKEKADSVYLWHFMRSDIFRGILIENLPGGIKTEVKPKRLLAIEIPIPPLEKQKSIVAKIKRLLVRIKEARKLRAEAMEEVEGLYTSLLSRIFDISKRECQIEFLENITEKIADMNHKMPKAVTNGVKFISPKDFTSNGIDFNNCKQISQYDFAKLRKRIQPQKGDILYSRYGTVGQARLVDTDEDFLASYSIVTIRPKPEKCLSKYLLFALQSPPILNSAKAQVRAIAIPDLRIKDIRKFQVPLPPLPIQTCIIAYLDSHKTKMDELRKLQEETEKEIEELVPSILNKAFKGEL